MTPTEDIILRWMPALRLNPACDTTRVALADELQESGDPDAVRLAEFIRVQCDLARRNRAKDCNQSICVTAGYDRLCVNCREYVELQESAENYIRNHTAHPESMARVKLTWERGFIAGVDGTLEQLRGGVCERCQSSGFCVHSNYYRLCDACNGTGHTIGVLVDIVRLNPVEWCEVTDKKPWVNAFGRYAGWWEDANHHRASEPAEMLPRELMKRISGSLLRANDTAVSVRWSETNPPGGVIMFNKVEDAKVALARVLIEEAIERAATLEPAQ